MPVVSGFRVLVNPSAWEKVGDYEDIWKVNLSDDKNFRGIDKRFELRAGQIYNIGCIYIPSSDSIMGHVVPSMDGMTNDGDIFTSSYFTDDDVAENPFGTVFLKLSHDPATLGTVCFSTFRQGVATMIDCIIEDISFIGFSSCGASSYLSGSTIRNCRFDIIGGAIYIGGHGKWERFGNGVEVWAVDAHDILVENCIISRTYDAATTIQGNGDDVESPRNVKFRYNKIYHCRQAFEYFLHRGKVAGMDSLSFIDCEFTHNIGYMCGDNGFSSPEYRDADILCYNSATPAIPVTHNLFYGGSYYCTGRYNITPRDNMVYLYDNQYILYDNGVLATATEVEKYRRLAPDDNSNFNIVRRGSSEDLDLRRKIEAIIGWSPVKLKLYELK